MLSVTSASRNKKPADKPVMETSADGMDAIDQKLVSRNEFDSKKRFLQSRLA
jgi:hypothetical protein